MRLRNRITAILKGTSGVSLIFVLGVMMMLLLIGISLLIAAGANVGTNIRQNEFNRVMLLGNSIHRNIMYSLQADPEDQSLLAYQLVMAIYDARYDGELDDITLEVDVDIPDNMAVSIVLSFPYLDVQTAGSSDFVPGIPGDEYVDDSGNMIVIQPVPSIPRIPETASIKAGMTVTVVIESEVMVRDGSRFITTQASYEYRGGFLTDDPEGEYIDSNPTYPLDMQFAPDGYGIWSLIDYETVESKVDID